MFPLVSRGIEGHQQEDVIATYEEDVKNVNREKLETCIEHAEQYNRNLYEKNQMMLQNQNVFTEEEQYEQQLNLFGNGIMGSIQIPKIKVNLPIYHGTEEEVLSVGAGHLQESSLPVGNLHTHSVLTGHRGLPTSQLFTRLDELEKGDLFFIHTYNRTLAYEVCEIQVVLPEEREILEIREGEDLVSLVTCTPYGINTHRLVVTGKRTFYKQEDYTDKKAERMSWRELLFTLLPFLFIGIEVASCIKRRRKKVLKRKNQRRKRRARQAFLFLLCLCSFQIPTSAAEQIGSDTGTIEIQLTDGIEGTSKENVRFAYAKVGTIENGKPILLEAYQKSGIDLEHVTHAEDLEYAAREIQTYVKEKSLVKTDKNGIAWINHLEEGVYLIELFDRAQYENVMPMLVSMPMWNEEEKKMSYDITVIPKHAPDVEKEETPSTADDAKTEQAALALSIAFLVVVVCGTSRKNSRNW